MGVAAENMGACLFGTGSGNRLLAAGDGACISGEASGSLFKRVAPDLRLLLFGVTPIEKLALD